MKSERKSELIIPFSRPISHEDTETQTWGCRQSNPDICINNSLPGVCAFTTEDQICRKPSIKWKKQYYRLRGGDIQ